VHAQSAEGPVMTDGEPPQPGDLVRLRIWREPDLSGDFTVDETGSVVLPRIGAISVASDSPAELRERLTMEYSRYLSHTSVEVNVMRRVQILGAVRDPGLYPMDATMTVEDGLALAGGIATNGDLEDIELRRGGETLLVRLDRRSPIGAAGMRSGDQIYVPERGWMNRYQQGLVAAALSVTASLIVALVR
jgi:protein involved in polysaccharide export with SLBB domain